jgi:hypothetical protein
MSSKVIASTKTRTAKKSLISLDMYKESDPTMYTFVTGPIIDSTIHKKTKNTVISAPVKSGKSHMVRIFSLQTSAPGDDTVKLVHNISTSSFHRTADEDQREALRGYLDIDNVFSCTGIKKVNAVIKRIDTLLETSAGLVVVHHDELDYGSGKSDSASSIWYKYKTESRVRFVLYSATPQELMNSTVINDLDKNMLRYIPPESYCGAKYFLDAGLAHESTPFFKFTKKSGDDDLEPLYLADQGIEILEGLQEAMKSGDADMRKRHIIIVRLTGQQPNEYNEVCKRAKNKDVQLPQLKGYVLYFDDSTSEPTGIKWDQPEYWIDKFSHSKPAIIFINQKCTRSTDWFCHSYLFATHDCRRKELNENKITNYNTVTQAQERVVFYLNKKHEGKPVEGYEHPHRIRLYGDLQHLKLSAGLIDESEIPKLGSRDTSKKTSKSSKTIKQVKHWLIPLRIRLKTKPDSIFTKHIDGAIKLKREIQKIMHKELEETSADFKDLGLEATDYGYSRHYYNTDKDKDKTLKTMHKHYLANEEWGSSKNLDSKRDRAYFLDIIHRDMTLDDGNTYKKGEVYISCLNGVDEIEEDDCEDDAFEHATNARTSMYAVESEDCSKSYSQKIESSFACSAIPHRWPH